jgi:hypothetical protein
MAPRIIPRITWNRDPNAGIKNIFPKLEKLEYRTNANNIGVI